MKTSHRTILFLLAIMIASSAVILWHVEKEQSRVLRLGHSLDTEHVVHKSLLHFQKRVAELSQNALQIDIYPGGQLGSERDLVELLQVGSLAMTKVSSGALEAFVPIMQIFSLPYVFRDSNHFWATLNGEIGQALLKQPESVKLRGLGYFDAGSRSFYTCTKPVHSPADLAGLKIRTMKSQTAVKLMAELGASATPISFGELYTALQQGVVDGAENNAVTFYKSKHFEVCKNYVLDQHNSIPDIILISQTVWQQLSATEKSWLQQAMQETVTFQRALWQEQTLVALKALADAGVTIVHPDKKAFADKVADYKHSFAGTPVGDLMNRIAAL